MSGDVTVCIPSIPPRGHLLHRALASVIGQTRPPDAISVAVDHSHQGAAATRNRAWQAAATKYVAFLDDDDEFHAHHLEFLIDLAETNDAHVVWGWFEVIGGTDPFPQDRGRQWDVSDPHIFPITALVNRELILDSGAQFEDETGVAANWFTQDLPFWAALSNSGGKFLSSNEITWRWHHHGANTGGVPTLW